MTRRNLIVVLGMLFSLWPAAAVELRDVKPDLTIPAVAAGAPAPGKRVRQVLDGYGGTEVHHLLYLPTDWEGDRRYPVIVEYAGNRWRESAGTVEGCSLGYGISGGEGVIWLCLPFVDKEKGTHATQWWGDVGATVDYCKRAVRKVCAEHGGDPDRVVLGGFSRGAIACNFIGLHDDEIAALWRGFICHSHYEGVRPWPGGTPEGAAERLKRLGKRPQFISHEGSVEATKDYLEKACPDGNFTYQALPFPDHTDAWVLRDLPPRQVLREWFWRMVESEE
jgi:hypothetical protein